MVWRIPDLKTVQLFQEKSERSLVRSFYRRDQKRVMLGGCGIVSIVVPGMSGYSDKISVRVFGAY